MLWSLFLACSGPDSETLVDELRIMAIQSNPMEIRLQDFQQQEAPVDVPNRFDIFQPSTVEYFHPSVRLLVSNPSGEPYNIAIWQCSNIGDGCLESDLYSSGLMNWIWAGTESDRVLEIPLEYNPVWPSLITTELPISPLTGVWAWVCRPGDCPTLDAAVANVVVEEAFANPFDLGEDFPISDTSLAFKQLWVSDFEAFVPRFENPVLSPIDLPEYNPIPLTSDFASLPMTFDVTFSQVDTDSATIFGYATNGGFDSNTVANHGFSENSATTLSESQIIQWFAPETVEMDNGEFYVIVNDGLGGVDFWSDTFTIVQE